MPTNQDKRFRVALSFPGKQRAFIAQVAELLNEQLGREHVLYDKWYESEFARPDLRTYLPPLYADQSDLVVSFLGKEYLTSDWCGLEWESVLDLIQRRENDAVMLCSLDGIRSEDVPGLHLGAGFVDINVKAQNEPQRVANLILERLQRAAPEAPPRPIGRLEDVHQIRKWSDLTELLTRARKEDWHELAVLPIYREWDAYIRQEMLEKAWPGEHIVQFNNSIGHEDACEIAKLENPNALDLTRNSIGDEGAREIAKLKNLNSLNLFNNSIGAEGARAVLTAWAVNPTSANAQSLDLRSNGNLDSVLPPEALDTTDAQGILAAYRRFLGIGDQQKPVELLPMNEAKLLVVGNEAVGKTSLIRYLVEGKARNKDEQKTAGTAIHEKIDTRQWQLDQGFTLNVWDFGGQEFMHGTHQFFLTERSLYLLVLEARREDDRTIHDWLDTITNRGGDSPVIVVINKCDDGTDNLGLDERRLKEDCPNILAFARTTCDPGDTAAQSIEHLKREIAEAITGDERLAESRRPFPQPYLRIRRDVGSTRSSVGKADLRATVRTAVASASSWRDKRGRRGRPEGGWPPGSRQAGSVPH